MLMPHPLGRKGSSPRGRGADEEQGTSRILACRGARRRAGHRHEGAPQVPGAYRPEFLPGQAEDTAWIVNRGGSFKLPFTVVHNVVTSYEFTVLEPAVLDKKIYAPGLGIVMEEAALGPAETATLVSVHG